MTISPFDLNLRHLRALGMVAEKGSLSRAAGGVGVTQSALTQGLAKLEKQLDVRLYERKPHWIELTDAGNALADRAARALDLLRVSPIAPPGQRGAARPETAMTGTQLNAFLHFATAESFAGASALSGISRPAVHRAVRELEQLCAAVLVERRGRGVALTNSGQAMARAVRLAFNEIEAGIAEARGEDSDSGWITVGVMPIAQASLVPGAIAAHIKASPGMSVRVLEGSYRELADLLRDGVIDLMVGALRQTPQEGFEQEKLAAARLAVFGRADHPILGSPIDRETLAAAGWVVGPADSPRRMEWESLVAGQPVASAPVECGSVSVICGLLARTDLLTLLSPDQVRGEVEAGMIVQIDARLTDPQRDIGMTTRSGWRPTAGQQGFLSHLREAGVAVSEALRERNRGTARVPGRAVKNRG